MTQPSRMLSLSVFAAAFLLLPRGVAAQSTPAASGSTFQGTGSSKVRVVETFGQLPLSFEANQGQSNSRVKFLSRGGGKTLFLTSTEAVLTGSDGQSVRMKLLGSNRNVKVGGLDKLPGKSNYFHGTDPDKWHTNLPLYARVRYSHIYPGVDLVYYGNQQGLEYDFVIAPGADPRQIRVAIQGTREFFIDADGDAVLRAKLGDIRLKKPRIYQELDGKQVEVAGGYDRQGHELQFRVGAYDHRRNLTIDPQLVYSTYLGGTAAAGDQAQAIAVDSAGNAYITGQTSSTDFPLAANSPQSGYGGGSSDAFVTKLNAAGNEIIYSTYLGGSAIDVGTGIAVDGSGNAYISGYTNSTNFPVLAGLQMSNGGGYDAFVTKLSSDGSSLVYSTYLGGSHDETAHSIALDSSGNVYITGSTNSIDFPLSAALQSSKLSGASLFSTGFVTKLNAAGTAMAYSTYLGGSSSDNCTGIAVDSAGNAYVTGSTNSTNFPVASPFQATLKGTTNAFISKLNATGSALSYSTYLGGSSTDSANAIAVDSSGNALVAGYTRSTDFPLSSPLQSSNAASESAFITKLNSNASGLVYSTYLGGSIVSYANAIAVDSIGNAFVAGNTNSPDFPLSSPVQPVPGGAIDAFVTALTPTGASLLYSTFLGGNGFENTFGIAVDGSGNAYVTGSTSSTNFPVLSPYQASLRGGANAFVAKINPLNASGTPTRTTISSSQNPSVFGTSVTFTATVTAASGTPTGTVNFTSAGLNVGGAILTNGQASITISGLPLGATSIMASYSGDTQFASSLSVPAFLQTVRSFASTTTLVSSLQFTTLGQPVTFSATVKGTGTSKLPTGSVVFDDGQASLGTQTLTASGTANFTTTSLALGSHSVTATYQGDTNFGSSTSAPQLISINPPATTYSSSAIPVGTGPIAAALNPFTHTLFVANQGSNDVTAIDTRTNMILASSIPVGKAPSAIGVNRVTNQVYVANRDSADVTVIDGVTYTATSIVVASVDHLTNPPSLLPFHPIAIAVNEQTNQVFVGSTDCDLAVIQGAGVTHPGNFLCGPIAMAASPIGGSTFVAEADDSIIEQYQRSTNFLIPGAGFNDFIAPQAVAIYDPFVFAADADQGTGRVDVVNEVSGTNFQVMVGGDPYAIAVNPVDGEVYVAAQSPGAGQAAAVSAVFVSGSSGGVDAVLQAGQTPVPAPLPAPNKIAVDPTNDLVYVANEASNDVTVIDGSALAVTGAVSVGTNPRAVLVNPDNCNAYVANFGSDTVSVLTPQIIGPGICLSSNWLTFPAQLVNTKSGPQTVTLTNIGNANLLISGIVTSPNAFIESDNCGPVSPAATKAIAPAAQCQLQAAFGPTAPGLVNGQIVITDNNNGSPHSIVLTGNAVVQPTVNLTPNANPAVFGQSITLTATVSGSIGVPTGTITFYNGQTVLGIVGLTNGTASINDSLFAVGPYTFTASYSGDFIYASASSPVITETVNQASTKFSIFISSAITSNVGDAVTFESAIQVVPPGSGNATEPNGQVTFYDSQTSLGSVTITNGQVPNFSTTSLSVGPHLITAVYPGDANLLGSTSPVLTQVVVVPTGGGGGTGGGGTGGGGTGSGGGGNNGCACTKTGNYADPVPAVDVTVGTPSFATFLSPNKKYTLTATLDDTAQQTTIEVQRNSDNVIVFPSQTFDKAALWAFSPDDDRFVLHDPQPSSLAGQVIDQYYVFDLSTATASQPIHSVGQAIVYNSPDVVSSRLQFSPSGRYFLYTAILGNQQTDVYIYRVQGVAQTHEPPMHHSSFFFQVASGTTFGEPGNPETEDKDTGGVGWGFSPDKPETSFVYAYVTGPGIFNWVLVNLAAGTSKSLTYGAEGAPVIAAYWQFDQCADVAAVVSQPNPSQQQVDWYSTSTGVLLSGSGGRIPLSLLTLETTLTGQEALDPSGQIQAKSPSLCGQPNTPAPPPGAPPVSVTPLDPGSSTSPVTLIFSSVSQAGQTTVSIGSTPPSPPTPNAFQLGNPPMYYNLSSTATFTPPVTICINYVGVSFNNYSAIALYHYDSSLSPPAWVNITVPNSQVTPPPPQNTVCGKTNTLSPFALFEPSSPLPASVAATAGTPQSAIAGATFGMPLQATVTDSNGNPMSGIQVTFAAPTAGPAGSFGGATLGFATTDSSGLAIAPAFTANGTGGSYSVTATVNGISTPAIFSLTNTQLSQTTTSVSAPSVIYGTAANVTVSVNSTGQLAGSVTLTVDGAAGLTMPLANGSAVFPLGVLNGGNHALSANFAAQGNFLSSSANATLVVTPAPLTLTADNKSRVYGAALPNLTFSASGFVNGDTSMSLTTQPTLSATATAASGVGSYPITISGAVDANYSITYVQGTLMVTTAPLTITAPSVSRQYGQTNPSLNNVTYSGFVNGDNSSSLTGTLLCATTATQTSPVGSYPITCAGLSSANYAITFAPGTLNVTSATLTITANNATKVLNAANPPLNWTATGFANGETASVLTASPICITTAGLNSPVGSYPITCSSASAANYTFRYVPGTLKIQYATSAGHVIQPPVNPDGTSVFNQGRTIPAKFDVYDANSVPISTPGVVTSFFMTGIISGTASAAVENVVDTNNPDTTFRWDGQEWIFNITTTNLSAGSTYIYTITLNDGSTIMFQFGLR